ncbi:unnamed protein product [Brassica oleracea var. botrytis]|uniref:DUF4378 domain-containing protein n=3 Tax=Brassica TaxID=3705 RepID=A0ABQ7YE96_BRANA|nr:PREDICTED: uncharacterized protein LOC106308177 [Brassica oleracea var. oleracea]KAG2258985.1 hypothetical protein Bca52824_078279 [Brassica carinata]KAH0865618.1 hypothetical protein HID58_082829 [Brassica napus]
METRMVKEGDVEKHIGGCMAGFFNIFDRPHLLSPKRFSLPKRLSSSSSPSLKTEPSLESGSHSVYSTPQLRSPAPPEFKQQVVSPRRFSKEAPRLSLDSRAVVDAKGSLKPRQIHADVGSGSPSVIARLMGLEALPDSQQQQPLQRSASESRVISRFVDRLNFQNPQSSTQGAEEDHHSTKEPSKASSTPVPLRRKSFFDTADFFPEPRQVMSRGSESDLETLKQLLEALRLKGLLHSSSSTNRNVIISQSPIRSVASKPDLSKAKRSENSVKTPNRRPTLKDSWRAEHVHTRNRSRGRPIEEDHEEFNKHGKNLLERCDKLLNSIAEMAASEAAAAAAGDSQPSPVSVLDASLYQEDSSPSPVTKRTLHFTELLLEDESFMSSSSDSEYDYISDILRASNCLPQESDIFSLLEEKQQYLLKSSERASAHERRLTFDAVQEIVGRIRRRGRMVGDADEMLQLTWSEFQKLRKKSSSPAEEEEAADLVGYVCGVLGRDLSEDPWRDFQVETSEAVLVIERLVFKDLVGETIRHMAALNRSASLRRRRRLLF